MTCDEITREFGPEVALLVDGVTKIGQLSYSKDKVELQAESLRKMFLAMAKDIRVILIKLADRLHNMRTLQYMTPEKQKEKARETMDIYAPIAQRLGISKIKVELDDLSLKYLKPDVYYDLVEKVALRKSVREEFVGNIVKTVHQHMVEAGIKAQVDGRVKHFFSIYKKMVNQNKTIDQIYDLFAVRILVDTVKDCYAALGVIHEMYKPIPGRFKGLYLTNAQTKYVPVFAYHADRTEWTAFLKFRLEPLRCIRLPSTVLLHIGSIKRLLTVRLPQAIVRRRS